MPNYYFDIETTGLNPEEDKIVTIQFMPLEMGSAKPLKELQVLKEWEEDEEEILRHFIQGSGITESDPFSFVPIGYNLRFEHNFLLERTRIHDLPQIDILRKPFIDLRSCGVIMNRGNFKGSGLDQLTGKEGTGAQVPRWYEKGEYEKIEKYVRQESEKFTEFARFLYKRLPGILEEFQKKE